MIGMRLEPERRICSIFDTDTDTDSDPDSDEGTDK